MVNFACFLPAGIELISIFSGFLNFDWLPFNEVANSCSKLYVTTCIIPRDDPVGHGRGNNPVEYVFFIFVTRSHKKQCRILIEV